MNNINQKNTIYNLKTQSELPYKYLGYVNHYECCNNLNEIDVNNLANQLVDNDAYIESMLQHTSSYIVGPKIYDPNTISSKADGYKSYGSIKTSQSLEIFHKIDLPLSSSVEKISPGNVKLIRRFGDLIIANIAGQTKITFDPIYGSWDNLLCCNESGAGRQVDIKDIYTTDSECFFAASTGIYQLSSWIDSTDGITQKYCIVKLNNDIGNINAHCIAVDDVKKKIYVGTDRSILGGDYKKFGDITSRIQHIQLNEVTLYHKDESILDSITDLEILNNNDTIAAGNNSLYSLDQQMYLKDRKALLPTTILGETVKFNSACKFNDRIYFGTNSKGLFWKNIDNNLEQVTTIGNGIEVIKIKTELEKLYVAINDGTTGKIITIDSLFNTANDVEFVGERITSFEIIKNVIVVSTNRAVYQYDETAKNISNFLPLNTVQELYYSNNRLALASESALSVLAVTHKTNVDLPIIKQLTEINVAGIDNTTGNSGFIKFITVCGEKIAIFKNKIVNVNDPKTVYNASNIINAVSLGPENDSLNELFAVSIPDAVLILRYNGVRFSQVDVLSEATNIKNLAYFGGFLAVQENGSTQLSAIETKWIGLGTSKHWSAINTKAFESLQSYGNILYGQNGSTSLHSFHGVDIASLVNSDLTLVDSAAITNISAQFIANGTGPVIAYSLTAINIDHERINPAFSTYSVGSAHGKRIDCALMFDGHWYTYILNNSGDLYLYKLSSLENNKLTSTALGNQSGKKLTDVQCFIDPATSQSGALFSSSSGGIFKHTPSYGSLVVLQNTSTIGDVFTLYDSTDRFYLYANGTDVYLSALIADSNGVYVNEKIFTAPATVKELKRGVAGGIYARTTNSVINYIEYDDKANEVYDIKIDNGTTTTSLAADFIALATNSSAIAGNLAVDVLFAVDGKKLYYTTQKELEDDDSTNPSFKFSLLKEFSSNITGIDTVKINNSKWLLVVSYSTKFEIHIVNIVGETPIISLGVIGNLGESVSNVLFSGSNSLIIQLSGTIKQTEIGYDLDVTYVSLGEFKIVTSGSSPKIIKCTSTTGDENGIWIQIGSNLTDIRTNMSFNVGSSESVIRIASDPNTNMIILASNSGLKTTTVEIGAGLTKLPGIFSSVPLKSIGYAANTIFVAGNTGLSCVQYSNGRIDDSTLAILNNSINFQRLYVIESGSNINLVAWTDKDVYKKTYSTNVGFTELIDESCIDISYSNVDISALVSPLDQLFIHENYDDGGTTKEITGNALAYIIGTTEGYSGPIIGTKTGTYVDVGDTTITTITEDTTAKVSKFVKTEDSGLQLAYLDNTLKNIREYPSGRSLNTFTNSINDFIKVNGVEYILSDGFWHYDGGIYKDFPKYKTFQILELDGVAIDKNNQTVFGTEYGLLKAEYLKTSLLSENSVYPLTQNYAWGAGKTFISLNKGPANSVIAITSTPTNKLIYQISLSKATGELLKFYAPSVGDVPGEEATIISAWCVNNDYSEGMFCEASGDENRDEYVKWLNEINGNILKPYTNVSAANINGLAKYDNTHYLLSSGSVTQFTGYGNVDVFSRVNMYVHQNYHDFIPIDDTRAMVVGDTGLFVYNNKTVSKLRSSESGAINSIQKYILDGNTIWAHNLNNTILTSLNYKIWRPLLSLPDTVETVNDIIGLNNKTYLFATEDGLYGTKYQYILTNDIVPITKETALSLYNSLVSTTMSSELSSAIELHLSTHHLSTSLISKLNTDFSTVNLDDVISSWQSIAISTTNAMDLGLHNDIINEIYFGSYFDGDVVIQISNYLDDDTNEIMEELKDISYITKRWMSGLTEIYINVPSTKSYYLNNLYGASNCKLLPEYSIQRKNLESFGAEKMEQNGVLSNHFTTIKLSLTSAEYSIDQLLEVQINGQSLPLGIYQDYSSTGDSGIAGGMYRSFIEPSVVKNYNITSTDDEGNWIFNFACFGTDSQAIRLMFYDQKAKANGAIVKIIFDANGGEGNMAAQKFVINSDSNDLPVLEQKTLKKNKFTNTFAGYDKIFAGWSTVPLMDNEEATYQDKAIFPKMVEWSSLSAELGREYDDYLEHKDEITLYAVWLTYQFSENDTTLVMDSNKTEFQIASVGLNEETNLKDKVVIDFGD